MDFRTLSNTPRLCRKVSQPSMRGRWRFASPGLSVCTNQSFGFLPLRKLILCSRLLEWSKSSWTLSNKLLVSKPHIRTSHKPHHLHNGWNVTLSHGRRNILNQCNSRGLWQWCLISNTHSLDWAYCLNCFLRNLSEVGEITSFVTPLKEWLKWK